MNFQIDRQWFTAIGVKILVGFANVLAWQAFLTVAELYAKTAGFGTLGIMEGVIRAAQIGGFLRALRTQQNYGGEWLVATICFGPLNFFAELFAYLVWLYNAPTRFFRFVYNAGKPNK